MRYLFSLITFLIFSTTVYSQEDCKGCADYPLLPRMPNFYIEKYNEFEFDAQEFYYDNKKHNVEGKKIVIKLRHNNWKDKDYKFPTRLQILRNYSNAITIAGGNILFERYNAEHGYYNFGVDNQKKIWVKIRPASSGNNYEIIIIEQEELRQDIVIEANLIKDNLNLNGRVAINGIYFDVGKAIIKKESEAAISEIAKYLKANSAVKCWVVGHTSAEGSFQINSNLSLERAKAIKNELEEKYSISSDRLFAEGVGPLSPVTTNKTEEGKKLNRRVELVLK